MNSSLARLTLTLTLAALGIAFLAGCDTTRVTQTFGEVIVKAPAAPAVATTIEPRTHATHEVAIPENYTGDPAIVLPPLVVEPAPVIAYEPCFEQPVEAPETGCSHPVSVPAVGTFPLAVDRFEHVEPQAQTWGRPVVLLPDSCLYVTKLDADGVTRSRWENGKQETCQP